MLAPGPAAVMPCTQHLAHQTARRLLFCCSHKNRSFNLVLKRSCDPHAQRLVKALNSSSSNGSTASRPEGKLLDFCIGPQLQLMKQEYSVAGHVLRLIAPYDVDAVMDMYIAAGIDGDPYWCRVWPSAISLAQQLLQRPELVAGKTVADLGAGLGVGGIAAALAGAKEVVLLDREPLALQCGLISAAASGVNNVVGMEGTHLQPLGSSSSSVNDASQQPATAASAELLQLAHLYLQHRMQQQQGDVPAGNLSPLAQAAAHSSSSSSAAAAGTMLKQLLGNHSTSSSSSSSSTGVLKAVTFDWSSNTVPGRYDVVLACDVLYEDTAVEPVASVVRKLLKPSPGRTLLLADPPNRTAANRQRFVELLSERAAGGKSGVMQQMLLEESGVYQCDVNQLDPEMVGGVATQSVPVQFMAFRTVAGNDTIGVKLD